MNDSHFMALALQQAQAAAAQGEVPVGAVVVAADGSTVLAQAGNACIGTHDPTGHAEVRALRQAAQAANNYRLDGCTLYVTLEPCTMCSGAMLHARLARVVYGAAEPKMGAAGSVLDVFQQPFNHHTVIEAVADSAMQQQCAALLQDFFAQRRQQAQKAYPLPDFALRTPEACFDQVPGMPAAGCYTADLPSTQGMRLHYTDTSPDDSNASVLLCLHSEQQWSCAFADMARAGWRIIAPDLIGFGRSDKPKKAHWHNLPKHTQIVQMLLQHLGVQHYHWVGQGLGALIGQQLAAPQAKQAWQQYTTQWPKAVWQAPYPDKGHRAALQAWQHLQA